MTNLVHSIYDKFDKDTSIDNNARISTDPQ